jgi:uncharacterized protein YbjT (DUF2867 family)
MRRPREHLILREPLDLNHACGTSLALTSDGHADRTYVLTGPEAVTQADQAAQIGAAVGRDVRWDELAPGAAREQLLQAWGDPGFVDHALGYWASLVDNPEPVTDTVRRVTGGPARTFAEWAHHHPGAFR